MHFATPVASPLIGTISAKPPAPGDRMTRHSLYRRIKMSRLLLLLCVDHITFLLGINRLAKCKRSASNLPYKLFYRANISLRRDSLARRFTLTSSGWGDVSLAPTLGEPRELSKNFKLFPKSKKRKWELRYPKCVVAPLAALINEHNAHLTQTATLRLQERCCFNIEHKGNLDEEVFDLLSSNSILSYSRCRASHQPEAGECSSRERTKWIPLQLEHNWCAQGQER